VCVVVGQARAPTGCAQWSYRARPGRCPVTPESGGASESRGCPGPRRGVLTRPKAPGPRIPRQKNKREALASPQISTPQCWCRTRVFVLCPSNNSQTCTQRASFRSYHTRQLPTCGRASVCTLNQTFFTPPVSAGGGTVLFHGLPRGSPRHRSYICVPPKVSPLVSTSHNGAFFLGSVGYPY
jgi:hypothetical protein